MIRRTVAVSVVAVLTLGTVPSAIAAPRGTTPDTTSPTVKTPSVSPAPDTDPVLSLGDGPGRELYIVQLEGDAVPSYAGGVKGLAPVQAAGRSFAPEAPREEAYRDHLVDEQTDVRRDIAAVTGGTPQVRFTYTDALNGMAVSLTREEAREVAGLDGVAAVQVDEVLRPQTDVGPEWIGATGVWDGTATPSGAGTKGEGVVVGVLDTGINPANPSFHDVVPVEDGGDGYDHENPLGSGTYVGVCDSTNPDYNPAFKCNDKLIGAWDFPPDDTGVVDHAFDDDGHGTHTASTAAGNQVDATTYSAEEDPADRFAATRTVSGVAPHANLIAYDVCDSGCPETAIIAGIDQAIEDEVDVLNYSLGGNTPSKPWSDLDATGLLNARAAGIHVAASAGNSGPGAGTVGSPGDVPWLTSVGSTRHNRQWRADVVQIKADGGASHDDIRGAAFAGATDGSFPLVDAADLGSDRCLADELGGADLTGQIMVCESGSSGRVEKGRVVAGLGAEGMVLVNGTSTGGPRSLNADAHALPAVHVTRADGGALEAWMDTVEGERASLSGSYPHIGHDIADIMATSSGRGPNPTLDIISPSVSAPGVEILAGDGTANEVSWGFRSGTSMASPHVAGSLALLAAEHPDWTPAEAQSALMTTATTAVTELNGSTADWFDMGSGRVDLTGAADAGLVLDETEADYLGADPALGGDVTELNLASMADSHCAGTCTWTRTVSATETGAGFWTAEGVGSTAGITITVEPATFELAENETQQLTITADVVGAPTDDYQLGSVSLTSADSPTAHLPVAVLSATGFFTEGSLDIRTRRDTGSAQSEPMVADDVRIEASGLVRANPRGLAIRQDVTKADPYDGNRRTVVLLDVPEGATRLVADVRASTARNVDLYVGKGPVAAVNEVARSVSPGVAELVDIPLGDGDQGEWWLLVQNRRASSPTAWDRVQIEHGVVSGTAGNLRADDPAGTPSRITTFWDERSMRAGETWYGSLTLSSASTGGPLGILPVTITRLDDIIKLAGTKDARQPRSNGFFVLERPGYALGERLRVTYRVRGTARAGRDYRRLDGVATFRPGARTTREVVRVINRRGTQGPKVVKVRLTRGTGYTVGRPGATRVVIRDARRR